MVSLFLQSISVFHKWGTFSDYTQEACKEVANHHMVNEKSKGKRVIRKRTNTLKIPRCMEELGKFKE